MKTDLIVDLLLGPGKIQPGSELNDSELIHLAQEEAARRRCCVVRNWMLLDVMHGDDADEQLRREGLSATILYAPEVVFDSDTGGSRCGAIRSGYQKVYTGSRFETKHTLFILAGAGRRKFASLPALLALDEA